MVARVSNQWSYWMVQEAARFVAHKTVGHKKGHRKGHVSVVQPVSLQAVEVGQWAFVAGASCCVRRVRDQYVSCA
jgi:hypothetical protein